jgi:hypothetical protein
MLIYVENILLYRGVELDSSIVLFNTDVIFNARDMSVEDDATDMSVEESEDVRTVDTVVC